MVPAAGAADQPPDESGFAAAEVGAQLDDLTAFKQATQQRAEPLGIGGACRVGLPNHGGIHIGHIVMP